MVLHFRFICENQTSESGCDREMYLSWVSVCGGLVMREVVEGARRHGRIEERTSDRVSRRDNVPAHGLIAVLCEMNVAV